MSNNKRWEYESSDGAFRYTQWFEEGVLIAELRGTLDDADAEAVKRCVDEARPTKTGRVAHLIDASKLDHVSPAARRTMTAYATGDASPFAVLAIAGGNFFVRNIFNLFLRISTIPAKVFADRQEALDWLREQLAHGAMDSSKDGNATGSS